MDGPSGRESLPRESPRGPVNHFNDLRANLLNQSSSNDPIRHGTRVTILTNGEIYVPTLMPQPSSNDPTGRGLVFRKDRTEFLTGLGLQTSPHFRTDKAAKTAAPRIDTSGEQLCSYKEEPGPTTQPPTPRPISMRSLVSSRQDVPTMSNFAERSVSTQDKSSAMSYFALAAPGTAPDPTTGFASPEAMAKNPPQQSVIRHQSSHPSNDSVNDDGIVYGAAPGDLFIPRDRLKLPPPQNPIAPPTRGCPSVTKGNTKERHCETGEDKAVQASEEELNTGSNITKDAFALLSKAVKERITARTSSTQPQPSNNGNGVKEANKAVKNSNSDLIRRLREVDRKLAQLKLEDMLARRVEFGVHASRFHRKDCNCNLCLYVQAYDEELAEQVEALPSSNKSVSQAADDEYMAGIRDDREKALYLPLRLRSSSEFSSMLARPMLATDSAELQQQGKPSALNATSSGSPSRMKDAETQTDKCSECCYNCLCWDYTRLNAAGYGKDRTFWTIGILPQENEVEDNSLTRVNNRAKEFACQEAKRSYENFLLTQQTTKPCRQLPVLDYDIKISLSNQDEQASEPATVKTGQEKSQCTEELRAPIFHFKGSSNTGASYPPSKNNPVNPRVNSACSYQRPSTQRRPIKRINFDNIRTNQQRQYDPKVAKNHEELKAVPDKAHGDAHEAKLTKTLQERSMVRDPAERSEIDGISEETEYNSLDSCYCLGGCSCNSRYLVWDDHRVKAWAAALERGQTKGEEPKGYYESEEEECFCERLSVAANCRACNKLPSSDSSPWIVTYGWRTIPSAQVIIEQRNGRRKHRETQTRRYYALLDQAMEQASSEGQHVNWADHLAMIDDLGYQAEGDGEDEEAVDADALKRDDEREWQKIEEGSRCEEDPEVRDLIFNRERYMLIEKKAVDESSTSEDSDDFQSPREMDGEFEVVCRPKVI